ncbi:HTH-type transcriptional repressor YtrA [Thalassoglobus neptunius]|uniref:HTH-type transcriptional repressor YtrA n=1 Tax=Thalassoglobus neptunius TaxID=1938619 RepID=A0A5C5WAP2_9PLAN|nr:GntR family transcriptional regulator [Thalassoglobus neptunius]TWT47139.1 HTH-type transcriptional repressor YtrA [Thalassoglobus neptunius]
MFVRVEKGSAVPISRQISDQIRAQCLSGHLPLGVQVPSVRQLARDLAVNQNTVLRVYEKLTAENFLEMRHGEGTFVASDLPFEDLNGHRSRFTEEFGQVVRQGRLLGLDGSTMHTLLDAALAAPLESEDEGVSAIENTEEQS